MGPAHAAAESSLSGQQVYLDNTTPNLWDNGYYKNLLYYNGILLSDQAPLR